MNFYTTVYIDNLKSDVSCRFQNPFLEDSHCKLVSTHLLSNKNLHRLSFYRCPRLRIQGITYILKRLSQQQRKKELEVEISSVDLNDAGLYVLTDLLFPGKTQAQERRLMISSLELEDIGNVRPETWRSILPIVLSDTSNLVTLDLTHNNLKIGSVETIAKLLESNNSLKNLILSENPLIGDRGARTLSESLQKNSSLKVLSLAVCNISNKGIDSLHHCVHWHNTSLSRIYLFGNPYNDGLEHRKRLDYWLELNASGRAEMRSCSTHVALFPHILVSGASKKKRSDIVYGLLRQLPHAWISNQE